MLGNAYLQDYNYSTIYLAIILTTEVFTFLGICSFFIAFSVEKSIEEQIHLNGGLEVTIKNKMSMYNNIIFKT